jgi:hypothetical protein
VDRGVECLLVELREDLCVSDDHPVQDVDHLGPLAAAGELLAALEVARNRLVGQQPDVALAGVGGCEEKEYDEPASHERPLYRRRASEEG